VCGEEIYRGEDERIVTEYQGERYHFCSAEHGDQFEDAPGEYLRDPEVYIGSRDQRRRDLTVARCRSRREYGAPHRVCPRAVCSIDPTFRFVTVAPPLSSRPVSSRLDGFVTNPFCSPRQDPLGEHGATPGRPGRGNVRRAGGFGHDPRRAHPTPSTDANGVDGRRPHGRRPIGGTHTRRQLHTRSGDGRNLVRFSVHALTRSRGGRRARCSRPPSRRTPASASR